MKKLNAIVYAYCGSCGEKGAFHLKALRDRPEMIKCKFCKVSRVIEGPFRGLEIEAELLQSAKVETPQTQDRRRSEGPISVSCQKHQHVKCFVKACQCPCGHGIGKGFE